MTKQLLDNNINITDAPGVNGFSNILFIFAFWYLGLLTPLLVPAEVD